MDKTQKVSNTKYKIQPLEFFRMVIIIDISHIPNVRIERVELLLCILEVSGSDHNAEIIYPD